MSIVLPAAQAGARRVLAAAVAGTVITWCDYALFGAAAGLILGPLFFPYAMPVARPLALFATFAVALAFRPLGALAIGHIGDRWGRKPALLVSLGLVGVATAAIALLPAASVIGAWAPLLLVALRLVQGFGAGGELASAITWVAEQAPAQRRGFYTALMLAGQPAGLVLATGVFSAVTRLPADALFDGAWRIPFGAAAVLLLVVAYIRHRLGETPAYHAAAVSVQGESKPLAELFGAGRWPLAIGFVAITGYSALNYMLATFSVSLMTRHAGGMMPSSAQAMVTLGSLLAIAGIPAWGWAADRFGAGRVLALGGAVGVLYAGPLFMGLQSGSAFMATLAIAGGYALVVGAIGGAQGAFLVGLFPVRVRCTGIGLAREVNEALVGAVTPLMILGLLHFAHGRTWLVAAYLAGCCALTVAAVVAARMRGVGESLAEPARRR